MVTITSLATDEHSARVALAATLEPDDAATGRLIAAVGAVETVRLAAGTGAFPKKVDAVEAGLWRNKVAPRLDARMVKQALVDTDRLGLRVVIPGDSDWPTALNDLGERAPTALWVRGAASFLTAPVGDRVTITGARAATSYGEYVTTELTSGLADAERIIVAGGSYGIDAAAHRAALAAGGQTLAVMVGGLDRLYPSGNRELLERVGDVGLLASEMAPGSAPTKWRFLARNRILGALSGATVIVEAGYRSGSLNVAARATELGRPVGAVPGPVTSAASAGTHRLLHEGIAALVTGAADVTALRHSADEGSHAFSREPGVSHPMRRPSRSL
ncbi:DNA-protecting protein DprA [Leucobacter weissii]|uniref:DNA-protecting protein DprA n=1 Tax=Leucobacter weissii TaxID=1983706 RepID=A0A939MLK1_9MICO|nr:DNA-protecting protein DprA [Leucobacter weissii]